MKNDTKLRDGYRVVGPTILHLDPVFKVMHCWCFPTEEEASVFARKMCLENNDEYDVMKYIGSWRPSELPVEFVKAKEEMK